MSSALTAMSAGEDLPHFDLGPGDGVLGRGARHRLGEHVGQQIGVGDELDLVRGRRRPSIGVVLDPLASEGGVLGIRAQYWMVLRSEEHTSELQSRLHLVCRLLLEKKKKKITKHYRISTH